MMKVIFLSPTGHSTESQQRIGEALNINVGAGLYFARGVIELDANIANAFTGTANTDTVVVAINCHGIPSSGNFFDSVGSGTVTVTPQYFIDGAPLPPAIPNFPPPNTTPWKGLRTIFQDPPCRVIIVAGQCYGLQFAQAVRQAWNVRPNGVSVVGLSAGGTWSSVPIDKESATMMDYRHLEFCEFINFLREIV